MQQSSTYRQVNSNTFKFSRPDNHKNVPNLDLFDEVDLIFSLNNLLQA